MSDVKDTNYNLENELGVHWQWGGNKWTLIN